MRIRTMAAAAAVIVTTVLCATPAVASTTTAATGTTLHWSGHFQAATTAGTVTTGTGSAEYTYTFTGPLTVTDSTCYQLFVVSSLGFGGQLFYLGQQCGPGTTTINFTHDAVAPAFYLTNCPSTQFCSTGTYFRLTA